MKIKFKDILKTKCIAIFCLLFTQAPNAQDLSVDWTLETPQAGWQARDSQAEVVFKNKLWIMGGWFNSHEAPPRDVWSSGDGRNWHLVQKSAPWIHSDLSMALAFDSKIFM